jgi:hypothetical protein
MNDGKQLSYNFRPDGMFLCRCVCVDCQEEFDMMALAQYRDRCEACEQVNQWMREASRGK